MLQHGLRDIPLEVLIFSTALLEGMIGPVFINNKLVLYLFTRWTSNFSTVADLTNRTSVDKWKLLLYLFTPWSSRDSLGLHVISRLWEKTPHV